MKARTRNLADIRVVIGAALGIIGVYLLICSAFLNGPDEMAKTGGVNANLWSGLGLLTIALLMGLWWLISPGQEAEAPHLLLGRYPLRRRGRSRAAP
ncbi:MAG: hypothetical protein Q4C85_01790 [Actinomyces sp.]|uniref:hypothetical protein n=1 Tax=Actinomyces sp. TaxID=29317 RepID=UPI0026DD1D87|nr:hypothetical protein [Actinomyces sp.]MDO4242492.1 hypothetical protein [Actinomyces sp.]